MNSTLKNISTTLTTMVAIVGGVWFFGQDSFNAKVNELVEQKINSDDFKIRQSVLFVDFLKSAEFERALDGHLTLVNSNSVSLRQLLSIKMGIPQEDVADVLAQMYLKDRKRLINILRAVNFEHPQHGVWTID